MALVVANASIPSAGIKRTVRGLFHHPRRSRSGSSETNRDTPSGLLMCSASPTW